MSFFDGNRRLYVFVYADVKHLSLDRAFDSRPIQWESTNSTKLKRQRGRGVKKGGGEGNCCRRGHEKLMHVERF